jgi:hypothetical protein
MATTQELRDRGYVCYENLSPLGADADPSEHFERRLIGVLASAGLVEIASDATDGLNRGPMPDGWYSVMVPPEIAGGPTSRTGMARFAEFMLTLEHHLPRNVDSRPGLSDADLHAAILGAAAFHREPFESMVAATAQPA